MVIRPVLPADLEILSEIDGTIESRDYLHVERLGEGLERGWRLHQRPLRERIVRPNALSDDRRFDIKSVVTGAEDGVALMIEHDALPVALGVAGVDAAHGTLNLVELRVDFDFRRQGLASGLVYAIIGEARNRDLRAVSARSKTDNAPAANLLQKCGFEIGGLDERRHSNHDLVKESVTLFWYASLD